MTWHTIALWILLIEFSTGAFIVLKRGLLEQEIPYGMVDVLFALVEFPIAFWAVLYLAGGH